MPGKTRGYVSLAPALRRATSLNSLNFLWVLRVLCSDEPFFLCNLYGLRLSPHPVKTIFYACYPESFCSA